MAPPYGSRLMPVVVDEVARDQPYLTYALTPLTANVEDGFKPVTFSEMANGINRVAAWILNKIGHSSRFETIAYMGPTDLRYAVVFLAAVKCGYKVLLPSLRNSAWMNVSLLSQTQCKHVLYASEVSAIVRPLVMEGSDSKIQIYEVQPLEDLIQPGAEHYHYNKEYDEARWDPILVLHSSGSTGPPKPIQMNHATFAVGDHDRLLPGVPGRVNQNWAMWDFTQKEPFFSAFPAFHLAGFSSMVLLPIYYTNATLVLAPPLRPPTGHILNEIMSQFSLKAIFCPPIIAEQLVQEPGGLEKCKSLKFLLFAGGPLSQAAGEALSKVTDVCQFYGQTETGAIQALVPRREDWASLEWHPMQEAFMEPSIDGASEMVLKRNPTLEKIRSISCNFPDVDVWHTNDLFQQHPTKPNLWTFHGRTDDIIVLSNGEKFNPVSSETRIAAHPLLSGAIITGQGRPQASLILEPKNHTIDPQSFIGKLWPTIEEANSQAPGHGRISRRMVMCSSPSKPFDRTAKGTVIRAFTVKKYEKEISELYLDDVPSDGKSIELKPILDPATAIEFVRNIIRHAFPGRNAKDDDDLFVLGLDSLQVTEIISLMKSEIRSGSPRAEISWITTRMVYEHTSIGTLAGYILGHLNPTADLPHAEDLRTSDRAHKMKQLIAKYTEDLPSVNQTSFSEGNRVCVILTGSTGALGTQILARLLSEPNVARIYCLDRSVEAKKRVTASLKSWSPPRSVNLPRVSFHQADYSKSDWGLSLELVSELRETANIIIHNAWKVDFNHSLESFEAVHILGVRNMVDLSAEFTIRPRIIFISSISTVASWHTVNGGTAQASGTPNTPVPERLAAEPTTAQPLGYAESKAVAEFILTSAAAKTGVDVSIIRVGQITGPVDAGNGGTWNAHEWFPLLLTTSRAMGKIPDGNALGLIDWTPSDVVASAVWEIATGSATTTAAAKADSISSAQIFHLVNPSLRSWSELLPGVQARLRGVEAVGIRDWVRELENVDVSDKAAVAARPAVKVLSFFRMMVEEPYLGTSTVFSTEKAQSLSRSLRDVGAIRKDWIEKWMEGWGL